MTKTDQNNIVHVALALDASGSMSSHKYKLIQAVDELVKYLAKRSEELNQETRVTIYTFDDDVRCAIFDKDVLRLPSIKTLYHIGGMTALADATILALDDLGNTAQMYGKHAFLLYVLTDGIENASNYVNRQALPGRLATLPDNWTVAALVPHLRARDEAVRWGFHRGNVETWDTYSADGIQEVSSKVREATNTYMTSFSQGTHTGGTQTLFDTSIQTVNAATVAAANLKPLDPASYLLLPVISKMAISEFVRSHGHAYRTGRGYYELNKPEMIQANKSVMIMEKSTNKVFSGQDARKLLRLPDMNVRVKPADNPDYTIFVQSQAHNRKLIPKGDKTHLLLLV